MKYLVTSKGPDLDANVDKRFGHASHYIVIDPETMEYDVMPGVGKDEPSGGIERFANLGIEKAIVGNIGPKTYYEAVNMGWTIHLCRKMTIREAVEKVKNDNVPPLEEPTAKRSIHSARNARGGRGQRVGGRGPGILGGSRGKGRAGRRGGNR